MIDFLMNFSGGKNPMMNYKLDTGRDLPNHYRKRSLLMNGIQKHAIKIALLELGFLTSV